MLIRRPRRVTPQFVATAAAVAAAAVIGSRAVDPDSAWYRSLEKPRWQPPSWAFGVVRLRHHPQPRHRPEQLVLMRLPFGAKGAGEQGTAQRISRE
ncbi:tryptophan-rich sensory protein [Streptomyces platensis]|uniref:tryptophan-rich sensory protein n=1 Tax=Streptomyces platensis TaxID=58346 RepID=UPI002E254F9A|nr:tryptophan-rich sensory protein [Streptomyces platensis]